MKIFRTFLTFLAFVLFAKIQANALPQPQPKLQYLRPTQHGIVNEEEFMGEGSGYILNPYMPE